MLGIGLLLGHSVSPCIPHGETIASFQIPCWLRGAPKHTEANKNHRSCAKSFMYFTMLDIEIIPSSQHNTTRGAGWPDAEVGCFSRASGHSVTTLDLFGVHPGTAKPVDRNRFKIFQPVLGFLSYRWKIWEL